MVDIHYMMNFFFPSLHEIQTRLVLHDQQNKKYTNKNFPDCLMKKFKKKKPALHKIIQHHSIITHSQS